MSSTVPGGQKPSIVLPVIVIAAVVIAGAVAYKMFQSAPPPAAPAAEAAPAPAQTRNQPAVRPITPSEATEASPTPAPVAAPVAATPPPAPTAPVAPPVDSRELLTALTALDGKGPISAEDAQKWKASLQQLVQQGPSSVAAIREYLAQNQDVNYTGATGADQLGYSSLRAGLLNALGQIGGPEATTAMLQTLQSTTYPADVAALAAALEQQAPGQYQNEVLSALRAQLAQASQDQLGNANVGPLFQLLSAEAAKGVDVSADLAKYSSKWPYYSAIELATLPNGTGIPSLIQMAQAGPAGGESAAAQALVQLAPENPAALSALVQLTQQGQLSDNALNQLASYLEGRQNQLGSTVNPPGTTSQGIHISNGNQDFSAVDIPLTPAAAAQNLAIVDKILPALAQGSSAQQALQQAKIFLTGKLGK